MKWRTHRAITERVLRSLGLRSDVIEACLEGVIEPDRRAGFSLTLDYRGRLRIIRRPHHSFWRSFDSLAYIYKARKHVLEGKHQSAAHYLGLALHYIQDRCIRDVLFIDHEGLEAEAGRVEVPEEAIRSGFRDSVSNPFRVEKAIIWHVWPSWIPTVAVWRAAYYTAYIAKAVFDLDAIEFEKARMEKSKLARWVKWSAIAFSASTVATLTAYTYHLNILLPMTVVNVLLTIPLAYLLDRISKIRRWFGL